MIKIMIDAGHYGKYNQGVIPEYWESVMSWQLHLLLKAELEKYGFIVGTTRSNQVADMEVYTRGTKAKGYDMFLSLHSNATGTGVNESVDHPIVIRQNADVASEAFCQKLSNKIAELMKTKQEGRTGTRVQTNGAEYYGVLRGAKAVGCNKAYIIEHSFHSATAPCKWLLDTDNLKKMAVAEAEIIAEHFGLKRKDDVLKMTEKELNAFVEKKVKEEVAKNKEKVYHYGTELPKWAYSDVENMMKQEIFAGAAKNDLDLNSSELKCLCWIARFWNKLVKKGIIK